LSSERLDFFQFILTLFKKVIFAYSIGTCQNNMGHPEDEEIEYELISSEKGRDGVAGC